MSKLRECDRHGGTFSEKQEGWAEGTLIVHNRYQDGSSNDERINVDYCAPCLKALRGGNEPDPVHHTDYVSAYPKELANVQYGKWQRNEGYVKQMEEQNHIGESTLFDEDPKPGDKIRDVVTGQEMTVLQPQPPGLACYCGNPIFQEHYHGMRPAESVTQETHTQWDAPAPGSGDLD